MYYIYSILLNLFLTFLFYINSIQALQSENIRNGNLAPDIFQYQVTVMVDTSMCGGSIIHDKHILTAAQCIIGEDYQVRPGPIKIIAGVTDLNATGPPAPVLRQVVKAYYSKKLLYSQTGYVLNDIAILKLDRPLNVKSNVQLGKLNLPLRDHTDKLSVLAGFGVNEIIERESSEGFEITHRIISYKMHYTEVLKKRECRDMYPKLPEEYDPVYFCAQAEQFFAPLPTGICYGDSGSPLVYWGNIVIGIASTGPANCDEWDLHAMYTNVFYFREFIKNAIEGQYNMNDTVCAPITPGAC